MVETLFIALVPFGPWDAEKWQTYCDWAKIPNLKEIIGLDGMLCHRVVSEILEEDWWHIVNADFRLKYFTDLPYLLRKVAGVSRKNILGLYRNPPFHIEVPPAPGFAFVGYDLVEEMTQISALTNCGGFPDCFSNAELNSFGLLDSFARASEVHRLLREQHPEEPHAQCELYAVWKLGPTQKS